VSAAARLAFFGLLVAMVALAAAALGRSVGPFERGSGDDEHRAAETSSGLPGLASFDKGYGLALGRLTMPARVRMPFQFWIVDQDAEPVRSFDLVHERHMHLIVVRRDLKTFLHVHPTLGRGGLWSVPVRLGGGVHRVFADFSVDGERVVLGADLFVEGPETPFRWPKTDYLATRASVRGGSRAGEELSLFYSVTRDERPVRVEPYLGARGHLVILREGDLAYIHTHADSDRLVFETTFPSIGRYHLFLQYRAGGRVRTESSTLLVKP
jgi:hypothetical protein